MKNRISTGALFAMLMLMAMLPRTGHSQEIDPNAYYEIVSSNNLVLDNQDSEDDGTQDIHQQPCGEPRVAGMATDDSRLWGL